MSGDDITDLSNSWQALVDKLRAENNLLRAQLRLAEAQREKLRKMVSLTRGLLADL